jgi:hypothetical protein
LHDLTFHGLLLQVAGIVMDPRAPGAVPQNALAAVAEFAPNDKRLHETAQRQVIRTTQSRTWWETLALGLKREHALAAQQATAPPQVALDGTQELRVSYHDAIKGRPDLNLPRTPKTTLVRWIQAPQSASDLGVNPEGKVNAQMPLVDALLRLHAQRKTRRRPPQMRTK